MGPLRTSINLHPAQPSRWSVGVGARHGPHYALHSESLLLLSSLMGTLSYQLWTPICLYRATRRVQLVH